MILESRARHTKSSEAEEKTTSTISTSRILARPDEQEHTSQVRIIAPGTNSITTSKAPQGRISSHLERVAGPSSTKTNAGDGSDADIPWEIDDNTAKPGLF